MINSYVWPVLKDLEEYFPKTKLIKQGHFIIFL